MGEKAAQHRNQLDSLKNTNGSLQSDKERDHRQRTAMRPCHQQYIGVSGYTTLSLHISLPDSRTHGLHLRITYSHSRADSFIRHVLPVLTHSYSIIAFIALAQSKLVDVLRTIVQLDLLAHELGDYEADASEIAC